MDSKKAALNTAGVVFLLVSILHLVRVIFGWEVVVAHFTVPHVYSVIGAIVAFSLSLWMFRSVR